MRWKNGLGKYDTPVVAAFATVWVLVLPLAAVGLIESYGIQHLIPALSSTKRGPVPWYIVLEELMTIDSHLMHVIPLFVIFVLLLFVRVLQKDRIRMTLPPDVAAQTLKAIELPYVRTAVVGVMAVIAYLCFGEGWVELVEGFFGGGGGGTSTTTPGSSVVQQLPENRPETRVVVGANHSSTPYVDAEDVVLLSDVACEAKQVVASSEHSQHLLQTAADILHFCRTYYEPQLLLAPAEELPCIHSSDLTAVSTPAEQGTRTEPEMRFDVAFSSDNYRHLPQPRGAFDCGISPVNGELTLPANPDGRCGPSFYDSKYFYYVLDYAKAHGLSLSDAYGVLEYTKYDGRCGPSFYESPRFDVAVAYAEKYGLSLAEAFADLELATRPPTARTVLRPSGVSWYADFSHNRWVLRVRVLPYNELVVEEPFRLKKHRLLEIPTTQAATEQPFPCGFDTPVGRFINRLTLHAHLDSSYVQHYTAQRDVFKSGRILHQLADGIRCGRPFVQTAAQQEVFQERLAQLLPLEKEGLRRWAAGMCRINEWIDIFGYGTPIPHDPSRRVLDVIVKMMDGSEITLYDFRTHGYCHACKKNAPVYFYGPGENPPSWWSHLG